MNKISSHIANLQLSRRIYNRLKAAGLMQIEQLDQASDQELLHIPGFGPMMLREVRSKVAAWKQKKGIR